MPRINGKVSRSPHLLWILVVAIVMVSTSVVSASPKISVWIADWNGETQRFMNEQFIPAFKKKTGFDVEVNWVSWRGLPEKIVLAFAGGNAPDIIQWGATNIAQVAENGMAIPLNDQVAAWGELDDFFPPAVDVTRMGGSIYGLPVVTAPRIPLYWSNVFSEVGLDPDVSPSTWELLKEAVQKTTRVAGGRVVRRGLFQRLTGGGGVFEEFNLYLQSAGGHLANPDGTAAFASDEGVAALKLMLELYNRSNPPMAAPIQDNLSFANGTTVVQVWNELALKDVVQRRGDDARFLRAGKPVTNVKPVAGVFTDWFFVTSQSSHPDIAWEFLKDFVQVDNLVAYNETLYFIPPRKRAIYSDYMKQHPELIPFIEALPYGQEIPKLTTYLDAREAAAQELTKVYSGSVAVREALEAAAHAWNVAVAEGSAK